MDECLCSTARQLAHNFDESQAQDVLVSLNRHLRDLRAIIAQSRSLTDSLRYAITPVKGRMMQLLSVDSIDVAPIDQLQQQFENSVEGFWKPSDDPLHNHVRRRVACVVIFLWSRVDRSKRSTEAPILLQVAPLFPTHQSYTELQNFGRKYIKMSRKLGSLGSLLWLPHDVPYSTYEKDLHMDDQEVFSHLKSLGPSADHYTEFVQRLILDQLGGSALSAARYNLFADFPEVITPSEVFLLLLHALGGRNVPDAILRSVQFSTRRWNADGEIELISPSEYGVSPDLIRLLSDNAVFSSVGEDPFVTSPTLDDGSLAWSIGAELEQFFSQALHPPTIDKMREMALRLVCFACPPCYEGNIDWSVALKNAVWSVLQTTQQSVKLSPSLRTQVIEATLYFSERDLVATRRLAIDKARTLLRDPMPHYLHASVVLYRSILYRTDGEVAKSEAQIQYFLLKGPRPVTRRDYTLVGRLHVSQTENKIRRQDHDVASFIYKWEPTEPLSTLDMEVRSRLQGSAARFFQSVGDFPAAKASLEQLLALKTAKPPRNNSRRVFLVRLADVHCEMGEFSEASDLLQSELQLIEEADRPRRPFRWLLVSFAEANIGLGSLQVAESILTDMEGYMPKEPDDLHDQHIHMRRVIALARIAHIAEASHEAVRRWKVALQEVEGMHALGAKSSFTAAIIHISLAHAQITVGDKNAGWKSWSNGLKILDEEQCEFWIPVASTTWMRGIMAEVHGEGGTKLGPSSA